MEPPPPPQHSSSFTWWWDSYSHSADSYWFNSGVAEVDDKMKRITDLIEEENGETFAVKRQELIKMLQELHGSYRLLLAEKYDLLKSESSVRASKNGDGAEESSGSSSCDLRIYGLTRRSAAAAERAWHKKFSKLLEENLSNQAELIRRNDEKREMINGLISENRMLSQNSMKMKEKQSQGRKSRGLLCFKC